MSKRAIFITFPILLVIGVYFLGPAPDSPKWDPQMPSVPQSPVELENYVAQQEAKHKLKPDNQARIIWADSSRSKTEYAVVYLHGFSASQEEGDPIHEGFAKTFGCNLYLARLADHGVDTTEQLLYFTTDRWWASAKEALAIGKTLGEKVILMSTSTGGTMALVLAATYPDNVFALMNMSPNIAINDPLAWIANNPWGLQLARLVKGGKYLISQPSPGVDTMLNAKYWNVKYRLEAAPQLQEMIESKMNSATFEAIKQPSLTLYYYKNEQEQDPTVKVSAILEMNKKLGTPEELKVIAPIPGAGGHVIGSYIRAKDLESVSQEVRKFAIEKLGMRPITAGAQTP
jgi:esterase/lipase